MEARQRECYASGAVEPLQRHAVLDTPPDGQFDSLTSLAVEIFGVAVALVSLVDQERVWSSFAQGVEPAAVIAAPAFQASAPLVAKEGATLGALQILDTRPRTLSDAETGRLERLAGMVVDALELRASAKKVAALETSQRKIREELQRSHLALTESQERFRDLFDEAPIAYVNEDLESRFIRANKTALKILGLTKETAIGMSGAALVPDTPEAKKRLRDAFESIGRGADTSGVVLELKRWDNGKQIWIQWWSRPAPSGDYTRTMFVDITEQVQAAEVRERLEAQNAYLQEEIRSQHNFGEIVGHSPALLALLRQVDQVAATDSTALIQGETGTGKELVARAVHDRGRRRDRPLVKVNCGAISAGLIESELFGHVKGAFTGALANREGRFKVADGGTLFLDEVGELPLDTQVKLLRVLQEQELEPLGSSKSIKVDVRIIAATNRDLPEAIKRGQFRSDLYYRLNVLPLHVPALRERAGDIPLLVTFFLQRYGKRLGRTIDEVSDDVMRRLTSYPWPGNIRELQNVIERAVVLTPGQRLTLPADFGMDTTETMEARTEEPGTLEDAERRHIEAVLERTSWMIEGAKGAAKVLDVAPSTLRSRMQKLGIRRRD